MATPRVTSAVSRSFVEIIFKYCASAFAEDAAAEIILNARQSLIADVADPDRLHRAIAACDGVLSDEDRASLDARDERRQMLVELAGVVLKKTTSRKCFSDCDVKAAAATFVARASFLAKRLASKITVSAVVAGSSEATRTQPSIVPVGLDREEQIAGSVALGQRKFPRAKWCSCCKAVFKHGCYKGEQHTNLALRPHQWAALGSEPFRQRGIPVAKGDWVLDFGCHRGRLFSIVLAEDPTYVDWIVSEASSLIQRKPGLRQALLHAGCIDEANMPGPSLPRKRRQYESRAAVEEHHCRVCGSKEHNVATCAKLTLEEMRLAYNSFRTAVDRGKAKAKYSGVPENKITQHAWRVAGRRTFLEMARASPKELYEMLVADGLVTPLVGDPCSRRDCGGVFGDVVASKWAGEEITCKNCYHERKTCNRKIGAIAPTGVFKMCSGHGSASLTRVALLHWCKAHGLPMHHALMMIPGRRAHEAVYTSGGGAMYYDAHRRQNLIVWGCRDKLATNCEVDEKLFKAKMVVAPAASEAPAREATADAEQRAAVAGASETAAHERPSSEVSTGGPPSVSAVGAADVLWHGLPYVGFTERGKTEGAWGQNKIWLKSMGQTNTKHRKRLPPITTEFWRGCIGDLGIADDACINLHSDGGESKSSAYRIVNHPGFIAKYAVSHGDREWSTSARLLHSQAESGRWMTRVGRKGIQKMEKTWSHIKRYVPRNLHADDAARLELHVREGQWHLLVGTGDQWRAYCQACALYPTCLAVDRDCDTRGELDGLARQVFQVMKRAHDRDDQSHLWSRRRELMRAPRPDGGIAARLHGAKRSAATLDSRSDFEMPSVQSSSSSYATMESSSDDSSK
eukprot:TRINITY_DN14131_c0_g1_i5.p1 TRINITY_DN14131_c0_g1~~TRINITY_DN14131_c0_g1_i5.p1  ORF type:complete len:856 (+),score=116.48 TRINITY_DN14131_c0_g1_i5:86-2653(+)